jgi:hypothetical protein
LNCITELLALREQVRQRRIYHVTDDGQAALLDVVPLVLAIASRAGPSRPHLLPMGPCGIIPAMEIGRTKREQNSSGSTPTPAPAWRSIACAAAVAVGFVLLALIFYCGAIRSFFLADDFSLVLAASVGGPFGFWSFSPTGAGGFFRPLVALTFFADYRLWGLDPAGYHLTNVALHVGSSMLVLAIAWLLASADSGNSRSRWRVSIFAGLVFLLLPYHTEAVSWISGRTDVLATFFSLSSLVAYLVGRPNRSRLWLILSLLFFMCALLSKESAVAFPLVILGYEAAMLVHSSPKLSGLGLAVRRSCPFFILLGAYILVRRIALGIWIGGYGADVHLSFSPVILAKNLILYSAKAFFLVPPLPPEWMTYRPYFESSAVLVFLGAALVFVVVLYLVVRHATGLSLTQITLDAPHLLFLLGACYVSLLPVLNLSISVSDTRGDRVLYLASAFYSVLLVMVVHQASKRSAAIALPIAAVILYSGVLLLQSNGYWQMAGDVARSTVSSLARLEGAGRIVVANVPDHVGGAYILRNGLAAAAALFYPNLAADIVVVATHQIRSRHDMVDLTVVEGSYTVHLREYGAQFVYFYPSPYAELQSRGTTSYSARLLPNGARQSLVYYSSGELQSAPAGVR